MYRKRVQIKILQPNLEWVQYGEPKVIKSLTDVVNDFLKTIEPDDFIDIRYSCEFVNQYASERCIVIYSNEIGMGVFGDIKKYD